MKRWVLCFAMMLVLTMSFASTSFAWWAVNKTIYSVAQLSNGQVQVKVDNGATQLLTSAANANNKAILAALLTAQSSTAPVDLEIVSNALVSVIVKNP